MDTILVLLHTESDGSLAKSGREALGAAKGLQAALGGSKLTVGIVGEDIRPAANAVASCGADQFLGLSGPPFGQSRYATDALAAEAISRESGATLILAPAT